ncbi:MULTISPECIES: helix-turn-helix transcriptional regulator [unclassified Sphingomonas]|uniref:helix-turn-helix transcriptional regulator n=1 Tax=unclassified Sphingomonas TaxID=196159 RepID=UPI0026A84DCB
MVATNNLKKILPEEGVTQVQLAKASGLSEGTINKIYNGKRTPAPTSMFKILKGLNELSNRTYAITDVFPKYKPDGDDEQED